MVALALLDGRRKTEHRREPVEACVEGAGVDRVVTVELGVPQVVDVVDRDGSVGAVGVERRVVRAVDEERGKTSL